MCLRGLRRVLEKIKPKACEGKAVLKAGAINEECVMFSDALDANWLQDFFCTFTAPGF